MRESGPASAEPEFIVGAKHDVVNRRVPSRLRLCSPLIRHPPALGGAGIPGRRRYNEISKLPAMSAATENWKLETGN